MVEPRALQPLEGLETRRTAKGRLAAFGVRNLARLTGWRARRHLDDLGQHRPSDQLFRGFIQINLIRPN